MVMHSAAGTASQIPFTPMRLGRISIFATIRTKVRMKDMAADIFPLENAVNIAEENMFSPAKR